MPENSVTALRERINEECAKLKRLVNNLDEAVDMVTDFLPDLEGLEEFADLYIRWEATKVEAIDTVCTQQGLECKQAIDQALISLSNLGEELKQAYWEGAA